jgi:hyperosmotically inducible periplasmic protein
MRKTYAAIAVATMSCLFLTLAGAQAAQPPASNQTVTTPQDTGAQNQMQSEQVSPEAQQAIFKKIVHAIVMLPYYGVYDNIGFRLQGRTVILEGQVLRSSLKPDAERAVKKVEGVDKVVNNIEVLPPGPIDQRIREQVREAIYSYGPLFKYSNMPNPPIRIIVKNARVTLTGVVDNETDKGLCTMRANQVHDVLSVTNNLRVVKP